MEEISEVNYKQLYLLELEKSKKLENQNKKLYKIIKDLLDIIKSIFLSRYKKNPKTYYINKYIN